MNPFTAGQLPHGASRRQTRGDNAAAGGAAHGSESTLIHNLGHALPSLRGQDTHSSQAPNSQRGAYAPSDATEPPTAKYLLPMQPGGLNFLPKTGPGKQASICTGEFLLDSATFGVPGAGRACQLPAAALLKIWKVHCCLAPSVHSPVKQLGCDCGMLWKFCSVNGMRLRSRHSFLCRVAIRPERPRSRSTAPPPPHHCWGTADLQASAAAGGPSTSSRVSSGFTGTQSARRHRRARPH